MQWKILPYCFILMYSVGYSVAVESSLEGLTCREEFSFGYNYRFFHKVADITNNRTDGFHLDFKIRARSDAHILFTETAYPPASDDMYEVVLGAGRNSYSDIRRGRGTSSKADETTLNIVSAIELRGFWIKIQKDGRIMVGKEGDDLPFLMWRDPSPIRINYFAFSTWKDVYGKWYYNCKKNTEKSEEDDIVTRPITMTEKLRKNLLTDYDPFIAPQTSDSNDSKRTIVYVHLASNHVDLDEKRSVLNVHGTMSMSWVDEKLRWSPSDYDNLTSLTLTVYEAWIPDLKLYNSANGPSDYYINGLMDVGLIVSSEGTVFWAPQAHYSAFCETLDLRQWPKDVQTCELRLGFWSEQHLLQLMLMENGTYIEEQRSGTEWQVTDMSAEMVWIRTPWASTTNDLGIDVPLLEDGNDLVDPVTTNEFRELEIVVHSSMAIKFTLSRRNRGYNTVLLIPLAMIIIFTMLSFWTSPFGSSKLGLQCLSLITIVLFLLVTWRILPVHADHVPSIISAYRGVMVMVCISMVSSVIIINFTRYAPVKHFPPLLSQLLTSQWMSNIFFLPTNNEQVNERYNTLDDTQRLSDEFADKDPTLSDHELQWNWILLSTFIDRVLFFIYGVLFFYIFTSFL